MASTLGIGVPLLFAFAVMFSVAFNFLAHDLSSPTSDFKQGTRNVIWWHFLLVGSIVGNIIMLAWYVNLDRGVRTSKILAWTGITFQILNTIASVLFIIGGATNWFVGSDTDVQDAVPISNTIRVYTIVIGSVGVLAFGASFIWGILVVLNKNSRMYGGTAVSPNGDQYKQQVYMAPVTPVVNNLPGRAL